MSDGLERLWSTWRGDYVRAAGEHGGEPVARDACVLCGVLAGEGIPGQVVHRGDLASVILNAFPYNSGHVLVLPHDHVGRLGELAPEAADEVFALVQRSVAVIEAVYRPDGVNFGANLGRSAGAGIPDHLHTHVLPRWAADTNFMTAIAGTRVMPESLAETAAKLREGFGG